MGDLSQKQLSLVCRVSSVHIKLESLISMCFFRASSSVPYRRLAEAVLQPAGSLAFTGRIPEMLWERESAILHSAGRNELPRASEIPWDRFTTLWEQIQKASVVLVHSVSFCVLFWQKLVRTNCILGFYMPQCCTILTPHRVDAAKQG